MEDWYKLLRDDAPVAALSIAALGIGLLLLTASGGSVEPGKTILLYAAQGLLGIGCAGFALGLVILAIKTWRN